MKLTKLELSGFKSFADTVTLSFEQGVTAIVGPNGCGKSNVSDAVRWVLGEQSARLLRGGKMEDVIFQGAATRRPVNVTEVSLYLDNSDGDLPIAYQEVVITRRLSRSGQSDYLLNKAPVRLRDIQDLLRGTGLGSGIYVDGRCAWNLELGHHTYNGKESYEDRVSDATRKSIGNKKWRKRVVSILEKLDPIFNYRKLYLGGGNARHVSTEGLPENVVIVDNLAGLLGGIKLWA